MIQFWFSPYVKAGGYEYHIFFGKRFKVMRFSGHWVEEKVFSDIESAINYIRTIRRVKRVLSTDRKE